MLGLYLVRIIQGCAVSVPASYALIGWRTAIYMGLITGVGRACELYSSLNELPVRAKRALPGQDEAPADHALQREVTTHVPEYAAAMQADDPPSEPSALGT